MKERCRINITGAVQGVGFRPFIYRLARDMKLCGWVLNSGHGVVIEIEGEEGDLKHFIDKLKNDKPANAFIQGLEVSVLPLAGYNDFRILQSKDEGAPTALILPDIGTCNECVAEIFDPSNRRYLYPFTTCTDCGPRYSIIETLPFDRENTTMKGFQMCPLCKEEYEDPRNRRFHSQTNACPACGPSVYLWDKKGRTMADGIGAIKEAVEAIRKGYILAMKGLGGFHLIVDGRNEGSVRRLRRLKHREEKPFALMYPSLEKIREDCEVSRVEESLLLSPQYPIVLLKRRYPSSIADSVAPGNPYLGVMLPYTPLHHIFMKLVSLPVVATSGNVSDEPICTDEYEALKRLGPMVDLFLVHNRPIARYVDDSVVRLIMGRMMILRRARGFAPLPFYIDNHGRRYSLLAVGGHLKNTIAFTRGNNIFISPHIGDLEMVETFEAFKKVLHDFKSFYSMENPRVVTDLHPHYISTQYARDFSPEIVQIQHHFAHVASCMLDNHIDRPLLGVAWDGTGYGGDGSIWGGEFITYHEGRFHRVATFLPFRLPGGEKAIKEPARIAMSLLYETYSRDELDGAISFLKYFNPLQLGILKKMLQRGLNSPYTTSAGRLFDGISSLLGIRYKVSYEGQAAIELEYRTQSHATQESYPFNVVAGNEGLLYIDWRPVIKALVEDMKKGFSVNGIATKFHNTMVEIILYMARYINIQDVALTGGCFQNVYLAEKVIRRLKKAGFNPFWHQLIPPNDGGIAAGQLYAVILQNKWSGDL